MKRRTFRFQFSILSLLFLLAFAAILIPSFGPITNFITSKPPRGVPILSNIPWTSNARRTALKRREPGYVPSNLIKMATPNIVITEEVENDQFLPVGNAAPSSLEH